MATTKMPFNAESLFDAIGPAYETAFADYPTQLASIDWLLHNLPAHASVLDIGCGSGRPVCSSLASAGHHVEGIDVSSAMIAACKQNVPTATFQKIDIKDFEPAAGQKYDAITVYFTFLASMTQNQIRGHIARVYKWLKEGGLFVFATVPISANNVELEWMGRRIVTSSLSRDEVLEAVKAAGFQVVKVVDDKLTPNAVEAGICKEEHVQEEDHIFVYAKK
jgi:cyclopropane fatty-acyl-phospholipid synthase-like methyltransferase